VLSGSAAEFERDMPFSVWVDALDAYVASQDLARHPAFDDALAGELGAVLPALLGAGAPAGHAGADERYRAHRAISTLLAILSENQALVLILDDLHWSDGASIELVVSMLRRWTSASALLALAFRPAQAPARLTAALVAPAVTRLALEPLDEAQAAQLLHGVDAASVAAMFRHGGGNPFYLEQLARSGTLHAGGGGALADGVVPAAVAASLADELASLSAAARALLDGAAVAGEPFEPDTAAAIAELAPGTALAALDELLALDLARPTRVPRRFIFRHPLVRRAVYEATPGGWRLAAHARAAAVLRAQGAGPVERAHHVEQAAAPGDEAAIALDHAEVRLARLGLVVREDLRRSVDRLADPDRGVRDLHQAGDLCVVELRLDGHAFFLRWSETGDAREVEGVRESVVRTSGQSPRGRSGPAGESPAASLAAS
jgi:AAA ATPase-like protein